MTKRLLTLPHIRIHNANALSSPFTIGFPAITAWLGFVHALERKLREQGHDVLFDGVGVVNHAFELQTYKGDGDYVNSIIGTANPLDKDGSRSAFIEEARCHLEVSLVIECDDDIASYISDSVKSKTLLQDIHQHLHKMKIAGGDVLAIGQPEIKALGGDEPEDIARFMRTLMPGYVLTERRDLMIDAMKEGNDAMEALLSYLTLNHNCEKNEDESISWHSYRKASGWIVPIATGFHGISDLGHAKNQRDPNTPHRFAESLVTLGEFKMAYKIKDIDDILWRYDYEPENSLYLCQQQQFTK